MARAHIRPGVRGLDSPWLVLSLKHGESDFFRYLEINPLFYRSNLAKIIELQARREYEGCGEYPSFVGWDCQQFPAALAQVHNVVGVSVWCQTGGWVPFRRLAYIGSGSIWTEINTNVITQIFIYGRSVEQALFTLAGAKKYAACLEFFRLNDEVIKELLYTEEFARQRLFFRRVRIPPLVGVHWNHIFINHSLRKTLRYFIRDSEHCMHSGIAAYGKIKQMRKLAVELEYPVDDLAYMQRTFKILLLARKYFLLPYDETIRQRLRKAKRKYKKHYPKGCGRYRYTIRLNFTPFRMHSKFIHWTFRLLLRRRQKYRLIDQIFVIHLLSLIYRLVRVTRSRWIPKFARKSAMGIDAVFK